MKMFLFSKFGKRIVGDSSRSSKLVTNSKNKTTADERISFLSQQKHMEIYNKRICDVIVKQGPS
jgi:hypothetical protein